MKKVSKDSAKSFQQIQWQLAVAEYGRMKRWETCGSESLRSYANKKMRDLEAKYPNLAKLI